MSHSSDDACIFCRIGAHEIASEVVFENDAYIAFKDTNPRAKIHVLVIPKIHIILLSDAKRHPKEFTGFWDAVLTTCEKLGVLDNAKLELHSGKESGQEIPHIHMHILSD